MNYEEIYRDSSLRMAGIGKSFFLIGLLSEFNNRYQAKADSFFEEISWKQFFAIICIHLYAEPPTLAQLADLMGSSHQNVKQILNKLEQKGFVSTVPDVQDRRKQRVILTEKTRLFCQEHERGSDQVISGIFEGIAPENILITIETILKMDTNLKK